MFVGARSPMNVCAIRHGNQSSPCGPSRFFILYVLAASLAGEPPKKAQLHNLLIPSTTSSTYKEMYESNSTLHNSVRFKHHYETKKSRTPSCCQVVILYSSSTCVEHRLGELVSRIIIIPNMAGTNRQLQSEELTQ
jgi:hypothetical protein